MKAHDKLYRPLVNRKLSDNKTAQIKTKIAKTAMTHLKMEIALLTIKHIQE